MAARSTSFTVAPGNLDLMRRIVARSTGSEKAAHLSALTTRWLVSLRLLGSSAGMSGPKSPSKAPCARPKAAAETGIAGHCARRSGWQEASSGASAAIWVSSKRALRAATAATPSTTQWSMSSTSAARPSLSLSTLSARHRGAPASNDPSCAPHTNALSSSSLAPALRSARATWYSRSTSSAARGRMQTPCRPSSTITARKRSSGRRRSLTRARSSSSGTARSRSMTPAMQMGSMVVAPGQRCTEMPSER
mmetsp:Transcript_23396/g.78687  ORF Transcript_23396/g.78687 Transcript_23396/m.78687 type:complete len:250 (-) Transcript_23396:106-855(-)